MDNNIELKKYSLVVLDYRHIKPLQEDLKELSDEDEEKFLESLKFNGKFLPEVVWWCESEKCWYTMDGHARLKTYLKHDITFNGGYEIEFLSVEASDKQDAARKILIISSEYHRTTTEGLINFTNKFLIDIDSISKMVSMPSFDLNLISTAKKIKSGIQPFVYREEEEYAHPSESERGIESYFSDENEEIEPLKESGNREQKASSDFASINEIVSVETKKQWLELIDGVMKENSLGERNLAIILIMESFKNYESGFSEPR